MNLSKLSLILVPDHEYLSPQSSFLLLTVTRQLQMKQNWTCRAGCAQNTLQVTFKTDLSLLHRSSFDQS
jgi:hypothetical protein